MPLKAIYQGSETLVEDGDSALIGSDASSTIRIVRPGISRRHAVISYDGSDWKFEDAGSRNGSFENGQRVQVVVIDGTTTLYLGHPTDGEVISLVPVAPASSDADDILESFDLPDTPPPPPPAVVATTPPPMPTKQAATAPTTKIQPATTSSASDVEIAQLTAALRDQISTVKGLTWSVWAMIAVTAVLAVMTLFVGILSN